MQKLQIPNLSDQLNNQRLETGSLQVNEDWPGVFIRGDNAFGFALILEQILEDPSIEIKNKMFKGELKELAELLRSSRI